MNDYEKKLKKLRALQELKKVTELNIQITYESPHLSDEIKNRIIDKLLETLSQQMQKIKNLENELNTPPT